jgi:hypothetical protein
MLKNPALWVGRLQRHSKDNVGDDDPPSQLAASVVAAHCPVPILAGRVEGKETKE